MQASEVNRAVCPARFLADAREIAPGKYKTLCFVHAESNPSMHIASIQGKWLVSCFSCGFRGSTIDTVMSICGVDVSSAIRLIETGMVTTFVAAPSPRTYTGNPVAVQPVPIKRCGIVWNWLTETRGLSPDVAERCFQVGESSVAFMYPSGWYKVRSIVDKKRQYVTGSYASELFEVPGEGLDRCVAVEGEIDALSVRSVCDITAFSVPSGANTKLTDSLLEPLKRYGRVVIAADNDTPGQGLAKRLSDALPGKSQVVVFGDSKDANEAVCSGQSKLIVDIITGA